MKIVIPVALIIAIFPGTAQARPSDPHHVYTDPAHYRAFSIWPERLRTKAEQVTSCESGRDYRARSSPPYYGAYQFRQSTWDSVGGRSTGDGVRPDRASRYMQDRHAYRLYQKRGWAPWPYCGRRSR